MFRLELSLLCASLANLGMAVYVLMRGPRRSISTYAFFLTAVGIGGWVGSFALLLLTHNFLFDKPTHLFGLVFVLGLFLLAQTFPRGTPWRGWGLLAYAPLLYFALYVVPTSGVVEYTHFVNGVAVPTQGGLFPVFASGVAIYLLVSLFLLARTYRRCTNKERVPLTYFFFGLSIFALAFLIGDILLPMFGFPYLNVLGPLASVIFIGLTAYAIVRHELLDIRIIVQKGLIYSLLLGLIIGLYIALIGSLNLLVELPSAQTIFIAGLLTTIVGIASAPVIEQFFRRITDRIFFKDRYDYPQALESLSRTLYGHLHFKSLVRAAEKELASILRAKRTRIKLFTPGSTEGPAFPAGLAVPILFHRKTIGRIELDEKRSGDAYTLEDRRLLSTFAYQAATALSRARLYEEVEQHAEVLEQKVAERTQEIERLRARERQTMMDLSHGLQTPLTVLSTKLEKTGRVALREDERQSLAQSVDEVSGFVYDLLALASLESAMEHESRERIVLTTLVREAVEEITIIADAQGIEVRASIEPNIEIRGNEKRVRDALMNLLSNAVKYIGDGPERVLTLSLSQGREAVLLSVADTGVGIAPEELPHIFDRFYRAQNQGEGTVRGTGLGLAITKTIVEHEGGTIEVESQRRHGSRFTIRFPKA